MSFPGGTAEKLGGLYERRWTVNRALHILRGEAHTIEIESLGDRGAGIEFLFTRGSRIEAHQVKRHHTGRGRWTLSALRDEGVLEAFAGHLRAGRYPVFVSGDSADELRELVARAVSVNSLDTFRRDALNQFWTQRFETLCAEMRMPEEEMFARLPQITVRGIGELELEEWNEVLAEGLFDESVGAVLSGIERTVSSELHQCLDAAALRRRLLEPPYSFVQSDPLDHELLASRISAATEAYTRPLGALRLRQPITRPESDKAFEVLQAGESDGVLLAGPAGIGKSDLILRVIERARQAGWPVLAFRLDRLAPALTVDAIGDQLELEGSPASVLDAVADDKPSLLVIDQLDAVSLASGRLVNLWEPIYTLIHQAKELPGMKVLLACRQFDLDGDWRLRTLTSEKHAIQGLTVSPLSGDEVHASLGAMGLESAQLSARQRELLRIPLHLALFDALVAAGTVPDFDSATDLFDAFWESKQRDVRQHSGPTVQFSELTDRIAQYMSDHQILSVPIPVVESAGLKGDADALVSAHVLVQDRRAYAFVHESVFDYVFARSYLSGGRRVIDLLLSDEQDLFRRAQVRQLLIQQRDLEPELYADDLRQILTSTEVRFHIKQSVCDWLSQIRQPRDAELDTLLQLFEEGPDGARALAWRVLSRPAWFDLSDARGQVETWMATGEKREADMATQLLGAVASARPDRAAALIEAHDDGSPDWLLRTAYVVRFGDVHRSRKLFERFLDATSRGAFEEGNDQQAWMYGHELPSTEPAWAAELLRVLLGRESERANRSGSLHPLGRDGRLEHDYTAQDYVTKLADADPAAFVNVAVDFFTSVIDADLVDRTPDAGRLPADSVWGWRHTGDTYGFADTFLAALEHALQRLAEQNPDRFSDVIERLAERRDDSSQFLLYRGLLGNPARFADRAAQLLLEGEWRYPAGYLDQLYWATHELLDEIAPHLSPENARHLENAFVGWASQWERSASGRGSRGHAEFTLLSGLAPALSEDGHRRLQELQRRFASPTPETPRGIIAGVVQSPITLDEARRMSDSAWLRAVAKHTESWEDRRTMDLVGGAEELASVLQALAQEEPERFAALGTQLPTDTKSTYIDHLIIGLTQRDESAEPPVASTVWKFIRHVTSFPRQVGERYLPRLVAKFASEHPPDDVLAMVADIALHADDPNTELWATDAGGGQPYYGGDIWMAGMNSTRGAAAEAISALLQVGDGYVDGLADSVGSLASDPIASVRVCAAWAVGALMRWRRESAISLIPKLVAGDDRVLASRPIVELLRAAQSTHWPATRPIVERALQSSYEEVRRAGASLACVASLYESDAEDLAEACISNDDPAVRRGAADVFATNLTSARYADRCSRALRHFFNDDDAGVREEAAKVFFRLQDDALGRYREVGVAFLESRAFSDGRDQFIHALERSTADISELTLRVTERMLAEHSGQLGDISTRIALEARELSELLVRLLASHRRNRPLRRRALDWIDRLVESNAWGVTEILAAAER